MKFCTRCGAKLKPGARFCANCGFKLPEPDKAQPPAVPEPAEMPKPAAPQPPAQPEPVAVPEKPVVQPVPPEKKEPPKSKPKKEKPKKTPKKRKFPKILVVLLVLAGIAAAALFFWYAFGNQLTLHAHSEDVVQTLNSGSLDLPGAQSAYSEMPEYIKDMLGQEQTTVENGPVMDAVLPYIQAERKAVHGLFGNSTVEYTITAPDLESWLLNLQAEDMASTEALLADLEQYVQSAPRRTTTVEVEYARSGFFAVDWQGNYYTREFADAICGGFNTAYNQIYQQALEEMEELYQ